MAKEIPFFKFFTGEWSNGDITAENYKTQGVFINICAIYWTKEGKVTENFLRKNIRENKCIDELVDSNIIKVEDGSILISFLDEQLIECESIRLKCSSAGKKSALKRASDKLLTDVQQTFNGSSTKVQPLREDKEKRRKDKDKENLLNDSLSLKVQEIINRFDETNFENTERTFESTKEKIKLRLIEFLEIEQITEQFENRPKGEVLKHFRNWMNYNPPVKSKRKVTDSVPWLTKDITRLVKPDDTLKQKRQDRWDDFEKRRETDPNAVY